MKRFFLYLASFAPDLVGLVIGLFFLAVFGRRARIRYGVLWVELADPKKPIRGWFSRVPYRKWGATTFSHVVLIQFGYATFLDASSADLAAVEGRSPDEFLRADARLYNLAFSLALAVHELIHVEAYEAEAVQNLIRSGTVAVYSHLGNSPIAFVISLVWWALGGITAFLSANIVAWLRGEHPYHGSHLEEAAQVRVTCRNNPSLAPAAV